MSALVKLLNFILFHSTSAFLNCNLYRFYGHDYHNKEIDKYVEKSHTDDDPAIDDSDIFHSVKLS